MGQYIFVETLTIENVNSAYAYTLAKNTPLIQEIIRNLNESNNSNAQVSLNATIVKLFQKEYDEADFFGQVGLYLLATDNFDTTLLRAVIPKFRRQHKSIVSFIGKNAAHIKRHNLSTLDE